MDHHENLISIHQRGEEMETQYDCSDIPDDRTELDIAKAIVRQWTITTSSVWSLVSQMANLMRFVSRERY